MWQEFENGKTKEAQFVQAVDKIESQIHMIYEGDLKNFLYPKTIPQFRVKEEAKIPKLVLFYQQIKKRNGKTEKKIDINKEFLNLSLEPPSGLEPEAFSLPWKCSTTELRRRTLKQFLKNELFYTKILKKNKKRVQPRGT